MYAVIEAGGRQYKVSEGDIINVDKLDGEVGSSVTFDKVLLTGGDATVVGQPLVKGATVQGEITVQGRAKKVIIFKKRRRQDSKTLRGFRAHYTAVRIDSIKA